MGIGRGGGYPSGPKPDGPITPPPAFMRERIDGPINKPPPITPIPMKYKAAVYYYGLDWREIIELDYLSNDAVRVHLRSLDGELEWKGILDKPDWQIPMRTTRVADLVYNTKECPTCRGSGKVERTDGARRATPK